MTTATAEKSRRAITAPKLHRDTSRALICKALEFPENTASDMAMHAHLVSNGFTYHDCANSPVMWNPEELPALAVGAGKAEWLAKVPGTEFPAPSKAVISVYIKLGENETFDFAKYSEENARGSGGGPRGPQLTGDPIHDYVMMRRHQERQEKSLEQAQKRLDTAKEAVVEHQKLAQAHAKEVKIGLPQLIKDFEEKEAAEAEAAKNQADNPSGEAPTET